MKSSSQGTSSISVIIPVYDEENTIDRCLTSLFKQNLKPKEVIVVDDGSEDRTFEVVSGYKHGKKNNLLVFRQKHKGPGAARNLGARQASGKILVFVDADMTFDQNFLFELTKPILGKKVIGTDSQSEYIANPENYWALCWNIGRFASANVFSEEYKKSVVPDRRNHGGIYRAILKSEFEKVCGFEHGGDYSDDASLAKKLQVRAVLTNKAVFYHYNPDSLAEVWKRAFWIGSSTKFANTSTTKITKLIMFSPPVSLLKGLLIALKCNYPQFVFFKFIYDTAIETALIRNL